MLMSPGALPVAPLRNSFKVVSSEEPAADWESTVAPELAASDDGSESNPEAIEVRCPCQSETTGVAA